MTKASWHSLEGRCSRTLRRHGPELDGWDSPYEFYVNVTNPLAAKVVSILSPGRDKAFSGNVYTATSFDPTSLDEDIVWADGYFVRWPQKK